MGTLVIGGLIKDDIGLLMELPILILDIEH
jgi:hypothetical protein